MNYNNSDSPYFQIIMNMHLIKDNKHFLFAIASNQTRDFVILLIQQSTFIYCEKYDLESLKKINFFKNYENFGLNNCIEIMVNLFKEKKDLINLEEEEEKQIKISFEIEISISGLNLNLKKEKIEFILPNDKVEQIVKNTFIWHSVLFLFREKEENEKIKLEHEKKILKLEQEISDLKVIIEELKKSKINVNLYDNRITSNNNDNNIDIDFNNSKIINEFNIEKTQFIKRKINSLFNSKSFKFKLLYSVTKDGDTSFKFHELCDNNNNTLILVNTDTNIIFGGFASKTWNSMELGRKKDSRSFLFSINKQKIYNPKFEKFHLFCSDNDGPCFYSFSIENTCLEKGGSCDEINKCNYENFEKDYEINDGNKYFKIKELEIYKIIFDNY